MPRAGAYSATMSAAMDFLKSITGKILGGVIALAVIAGGISWWTLDEATRQIILDGSGKIMGWLGIVLILPWASFFIIGRIARLESNLAGGGLILGYTLIEMLLLAWLFDWSIAGRAAWTFFILGGLLSAAYNLFVCDWIAEKTE